jgi:hypothetical protein
MSVAENIFIGREPGRFQLSIGGNAQRLVQQLSGSI